MKDQEYYDTHWACEICHKELKNLDLHQRRTGHREFISLT